MGTVGQVNVKMSELRLLIGKESGVVRFSDLYGFANDTVTTGKISISQLRGKQKKGATALYPFSSFTFTNMGATGRLGPTTNTYNAATYNWVTNPLYFSLSGGVQVWTVPQTGSYSITVAGAAGGAGIGKSAAGKGRIVSGTIQATANSVLYILAGHMGESKTQPAGSGGGGGTFVFTSTSEPLMVAGGGGSGTWVVGMDGSTTTTASGDNGGSNGAGGLAYPSTSTGQNGSAGTGGNGGTADPIIAGGGGGGGLPTMITTQGLGGLGGSGTQPGGAGGFGGGGAGGGYTNGQYGSAGGGGGGYSGGSYPWSTGAGGGGSYAAPAVASVNMNTGTNAGHGYVTISLVTPVLNGLGLWLDANDAATITQAAGAVSQWNDKSGNNRHFAQPTSANRPVFESAGLNSKPCLLMGSIRFLYRMSSTMGTLASSSAMTYFVVAETDTNFWGLTMSDWFDLNRTQVGWRWHHSFFNNATALHTLKANGTSAEINDNIAASVGATATFAKYVAAFTYDPNSTSYMSLNGNASTYTAGANLPSTLGNASSATVIGEHKFANAGLSCRRIAEIMMYDRALTVTERQNVETYLKNKWGIP